MPTSAYTDRELLRTSAYATPAAYETRVSIYAYQRPRHDLVARAVALLHGVDGPLLDIGCGSGHYTRGLRADRPDRAVVAADLSAGMVAAAGPPATVADATALPFEDGTFGGALAMHMLYHVPEPEAAVAELRRVTRETVLISNNVLGDKAELHALLEGAATDAGTPVPPHFGHMFHFDMAEATARRHFGSVERLEMVAAVEVPDPAPVVAFIASILPWYSPSETHPPILDRVRDRAREAIDRDGAFRFRTHSGFLVCRR